VRFETATFKAPAGGVPTLASTTRQLQLVVRQAATARPLPRSVTWLGQTVTLDTILAPVRLSTTVQSGPPVHWTDFAPRSAIDALEAQLPATPAAPAGPWPVHIFLLTVDQWHDKGLTTPSRRVVALFMNEFSDEPDIMRTLVHEIGHSLNLYHNDGDALSDCCSQWPLGANSGHSVMNQGKCLERQTWLFDFCPAEREHLLMHPLDSVMPGSGRKLGDCGEANHQRSCL